MYRKQRNIHFVGVGGVGMCGIAEVLLNLGHRISGSDLKESENTRRLQSLGAKISLGHRPENLGEASVVVISSAVAENNPEVAAARRQYIPVIPRAEMLAELMRLKSSVAVAGSHGKTTTTSLAGTLLAVAGLDPTLVIGGRLNSLGAGARLGQGDYLVAEADESDGSFLLLSPTWAVVTNIDLEHMNYYRDLEHLQETFLTFINRVPFYGAAIICLDDPSLQNLLPRVRKRYVTYGLSAQAEISARNIVRDRTGLSFDLTRQGAELGRMRLNLFGQHNVLNALAACALGLELALSPGDLARGLADMKGVGRRFEYKGEAGGVAVIDDYGHHPTEIKATLSALAEAFPERRKVVLFQPHRYSRTASLFRDFVTSFNQADQLWVTETYGAGEAALEGACARGLAEAISHHGHRDVHFEADLQALPGQVRAGLREGDVVITLGAGSIWQAGEKLLSFLNGE